MLPIYKGGHHGLWRLGRKDVMAGRIPECDPSEPGVNENAPVVPDTHAWWSRAPLEQNG